MLVIGKVRIYEYSNNYSLRFYDPMGKQRAISVTRISSPEGLAISSEIGRKVDSDLHKEKWLGKGYFDYSLRKYKPGFVAKSKCITLRDVWDNYKQKKIDEVSRNRQK
ncbi:MAG: hypothetical protein F6K40_28015 [Okeania sp. SIO3I5]|uniref:hypothetical protein n=1 Tax=Okeania sp. SIO3I5 TaxID=2607805 RepID=UPI0013B6CCB3|nr:hypothetical protein [Okeania sp. SIO3I5]NEQ39887.1 hypothetical protein [Okeania sp. SIO3I5]